MALSPKKPLKHRTNETSVRSMKRCDCTCLLAHLLAHISCIALQQRSYRFATHLHHSYILLHHFRHCCQVEERVCEIGDDVWMLFFTKLEAMANKHCLAGAWRSHMRCNRFVGRLVGWLVGRFASSHYSLQRRALQLGSCSLFSITFTYLSSHHYQS